MQNQPAAINLRDLASYEALKAELDISNAKAAHLRSVFENSAALIAKIDSPKFEVSPNWITFGNY